jgi:hypothetical protein
VTVAELQVAIADTQAAMLSEPAPDRATTLRGLRDLHEALLRATPSSDQVPTPCLEAVAAVIAQLPEGLTDALGPRPRTAYRLLRAEKWEVAWQVLADSAVGVVDEEFDASTATGQPRTTGRLPLLTRIEPPVIFAELPGFRDPRYDAPDSCYDISTSVRLKHHLDEISVAGSVMTLAGWAAFDVLTTDPRETVRLILTGADGEISVVGRRVRRADLVSGRGEALTRRAWAGWSAGIDLDDPRLKSGHWELAVEIDHDGFTSRVFLGQEASELAVAATKPVLRVGSRLIRWDLTQKRWRLVISASSSALDDAGD